VCKYDDGTMKYSDTFRSFSKLRLLCTKKLNNEISSFDFNEVQSIFFDQSSNLIYGAFNLPKYDKAKFSFLLKIRFLLEVVYPDQRFVYIQLIN
jgi:hypothetical protein